MSRPNTKKNNNHNKSSDVQNEEGYIKVSLVNQSVFIKRKRSCPLKDVDVSDINYTNLNLLNKFLSERGKITGIEVRKQRALSKAIKRARHLALISPIKKDIEN